MSPSSASGPQGGAETESKVELHSRLCSCGGGSWIILGTASSAPCGKDPKGSQVGAILPLSEWRSLGKPNSAESYAECASRAQSGERREFKRFAGALAVKLTRPPTWRDRTAQVEKTSTEVIAQGGALVRSRMAVEEGEVLLFEVEGRYQTRAQVLYMAEGSSPDGPYLRLGMRFLDELMPEGLIPEDAEPIA
jgi:hypothetical protein